MVSASSAGFGHRSWFALGIAGGLLTAWFESTLIGAQGADFSRSALERCLLTGRVIFFYLGKLLWPANLTFILRQ